MRKVSCLRSSTFSRADLPAAFAHPAAYGDIAAATLALLSLATLQSRAGIVIAWIFNLWGSYDLLSAFYHGGMAGLVPGQLGAAWFIPTLLVPLMLITHALAFRILLPHHSASGESAILHAHQLR